MEETKNSQYEKEENKEVTVSIEDSSEEESDHLEQMREQARKTSEKKKKAKKQKQRNSKKRLHIAGIVAAVAGVLELLNGLMIGNTTYVCLGILFIVIGYFYYHLDRKF